MEKMVVNIFKELAKVVLIVLFLLLCLLEYYIFFFCRDNLKILLEDLNNQKKILKENGIAVDDKHYQVQFVGRC